MDVVLVDKEDKMLGQKMQVAGKLESVEGTLETLAAADCKTLFFDPKFKADPEKHESNPARTSGGAYKSLIGKVPANISGQIQIRGSGVATTDPDWIKYLKCCGFASALLKSINIGAITAGPFQHDEVIVGGTSAAQGRVVFNTVTGASKVYYTAIGTAVFQSGEVLTGATSGATATTSSTPASQGRAYKPTLTSVSSLSAGLNQDGYFERIRGARGNAKISIASGGPGLIDFNFQGVDGGQTDASFIEGVTYEETAVPVFKDAVIALDSYEPMLSSIEFDLGNKLSLRDDPTDSKSLLSAALTGRLVTGTLVVEMVLAAAYDFRAKLHAATEFVLDVTLGTVLGNKFRFYMPKAQFTDFDKSEKDGMLTLSLPFQANASMDKDNDLVIVQL